LWKPRVTFSDLGAHPALERALLGRGYLEPTPVQAAVLAPALAGHDLLVSSRTGSGKTVAFGLVLAAELLGGAERFEAAAPRAPRGLVIAPTRELAVQVQRELAWLLAETGARVTSCVGGMDPRREAKVLAEGVHLVVGTPGRLRDHLDRKNLVLSSVGALVLDEADEMLDMGFREELEAILSAAPAERRTVLFSATLPRPIVELARQYTRDARRVAATPVEEGHADIELRAHLVAGREREHAVVNVLRGLDPASAIVFRAMRETVAHTAASLAERGFGVVAISGDLTQAERTRAIASLRDRRARVLVATDVAARGLDLPNLELVLHADLPRDAQALQHRSGRTGRAGRKGTAVLLATPAERYKLEQMLRAARMKVTWSPLPGAEEIRARDDERLAAEIDAQDGEAADDERAAAARLLAGRDPLDVAIALVRRERARLPAPEELPETARVARELPAAHPRAAPRAPRKAPAPGETVWFRILLGREQKADPKWLLPLLCRRGDVTRDDIGKIVVLPGESRFEVAKRAAAAFAKNARRPATGRSPDARIEPLREGAPPRAAAHRPSRSRPDAG
jgi:ATP-dependent RNA helicase DeaD